jgi:hypothetical protein
MTECNGLPLVFASLGRRKVQADFDGGTLTTDAGALLLRQVDRRIGLLDALTACMVDPRDPAKITHDLRTLLAQRIFAIAMGYEDGNDHQTLRHDPLVQLLADREVDPDRPLASPSTLCRLENRVSRRTLGRLAEVFVEQFLASHSTPPDEVILDFDATDDPVHGQQQGRFFHGFYGHYCYLPLYVFSGDHLLCAYLRPANIDAARHSRAILRWLVARLRRAWPDVKIVLRGDSGFCRWKLLRWCDRHGVDYLIGLARNPVLERGIEPWLDRARQQQEATGTKQRVFGEFDYAAKTWDRPRRVLAKAEVNAHGDNPRFVVTSLSGDPQELYDTVYCQRGEMENRIKEQQLELFADRTSCHAFDANQFRLLLASAAYVLMEALRRLGLAGTELARAQCGTIRVKLLKLGARLRWSVRRVVLHLAEGYPYQALFATVAARLQIPQPLPGRR